MFTFRERMHRGAIFHMRYISLVPPISTSSACQRYLAVSAEMRMGRFLNVHANIILENLYRAELYLCRELMHE
jgi:hypothetical protein